jgi:nuclear GTP-binding protein
MVKVHGKTSKRVTLARKYNIQKKVGSAKKKSNRAARKLKKMGLAPRNKEKTLGLPNLFPFKMQMIQQAERKQQEIVDANKLKAKLRKQVGRTNKDVDMTADEEANFVEEVKGKLVRYNEEKNLEKVDSDEEEDADYDGKKTNQSRRAYIKDLKNVIEDSDVVLEVLDARDPQGCRNIEMENQIISQNKKLVLVLNKIDLVPTENARQWLAKLRDEHATILFKATTQNQRHSLASKSSLHKASMTERTDMVESMLSGSGAVGTDNMIQLLKNYCRNDSSSRKSKHSIVVGVIGFPNVGKSSLINSLKRARVAATGNTPGFTKGIQEIYLDNDIILLDSPGVVLSKENTDSLILRNAIKIEDLEDPITPVEALVNKVDKVELIKLYRVSDFETMNQFLASVARKTGKL